MTQTEYEQKKLECYRELKEQDLSGLLSIATFEFIFDRAYALGKQEKEADAAIQGWLARDKGQFLGLYPWQPKRGNIAWKCGSCMVLPINTFPDLTWESDPEPVEIIIKRKKKW